MNDKLTTLTFSVRRSELDIRAEILVLCLSPQRKTAIVYGANLNFNIIKKYLKGLIASGHLEASGKYHMTTEKGKTWVSNLEDVKIPVLPWMQTENGGKIIDIF